MNKLLVMLMFLFIGAGLAAQTPPEWLWATSSGSTDWELAEDIVCDAAGNVYVTGFYKGAIQFGDFYADSGGDQEIFVVKLDAAGNYLWAQHAGSPHNDSAEDIAIDAAGNVYITGWFQTIATFGSLGVVSNGSSDIFIAKLSPDGDWLWVWGAGGEQADHGYSITVAPNGHCFVAGSFYEEAFFGDHSIECDLMNDIFIAETNANGNWIWAETAGGPDTEACWDLAADASGNCYLTGYISDETDFGSTHLVTQGPYDSFVAKINDGNWLWAIQVNSALQDVAHGIALDPSGDLLVTGYFTGPAGFGGTTLSPDGEWDIYLAKLSSAGNWIWAVKAGGTDYDMAYDVTVDQAGNCYVTGSVVGSVNFGPHSYPTGNTNDALFIAKADADGNWLWARRALSWQVAVGYSIAVDASGRSFVSGYFFDHVDFGNTGLNSNGAADLLIAGLAADTVPNNDPGWENLPEIAFSLCPNPARTGEPLRFQLALSGGESATLSLFNQRGQLIISRSLDPGDREFSLDSQDLKPGLYLCRLETSRSTPVKKLLVLP